MTRLRNGKHAEYSGRFFEIKEEFPSSFILVSYDPKDLKNGFYTKSENGEEFYCTGQVEKSEITAVYDISTRARYKGIEMANVYCEKGRARLIGTVVNENHNESVGEEQRRLFESMGFKFDRYGEFTALWYWCEKTVEFSDPDLEIYETKYELKFENKTENEKEKIKRLTDISGYFGFDFLGILMGFTGLELSHEKLPTDPERVINEIILPARESISEYWKENKERQSDELESFDRHLTATLANMVEGVWFSEMRYVDITPKDADGAAGLGIYMGLVYTEMFRNMAKSEDFPLDIDFERIEKAVPKNHTRMYGGKLENPWLFPIGWKKRRLHGFVGAKIAKFKARKIFTK